MSDKPSAEALALADELREFFIDDKEWHSPANRTWTAAKIDAFAAQAVVAEQERLVEIVSERAQELAVIRHPTEREMGAFDAVSALEDEIISQTARTQEAGHE